MIFAVGQTEQTVLVVIRDDQMYENAEQFEGRLSLTVGSSGVAIGDDIATATITDDDSKLMQSFINIDGMYNMSLFFILQL